MRLVMKPKEKKIDLNDWLKDQQKRYHFFLDPVNYQVVVTPKFTAPLGMFRSNL